MKSMHLRLLAGAVLVSLALAACGSGSNQETGAPQEAGAPQETGAPAGGNGESRGQAAAKQAQVEVRVVATDLDTPWALAFAPDGRLFFTERGGRVRVVENGSLRDQPLITLPVRETAEGGAMGLAVDPDFPDEPFLYVMYSYGSDGGTNNRIARLRLDGDTASQDQVLLEGIPGANVHNGGRLKFGPDRLLYATAGDASNSALAQDPESLAGKILRLNRDGSIPEDNPFPDSPVYSLGHRNPQGLDWHPGTGQMYATEHGPSGNDEVNLIEPGVNYGWPEVQGESHGTFRPPIAVYSPAIAPAGMAFYDHQAVSEWQGDLFFAALRGTHLHRLELDPDNPGRVLGQERLYDGEYGRLRDVVLGPDGALYVTTSNRDGRGSPQDDDDRVLRIGPAEGRALLYPDLRTLTPEDLKLAIVQEGSTTLHVLRFANSVWNAGEGPLEMHGISDEQLEVYQRLYDTEGAFFERLSGRFEYHEEHDHWHFDDFARYELWTWATYDAWEASGRTTGEPEWEMGKTGFCLMDIAKVEDLQNSPPSGVYPTECGKSVQGISVGWGDVYESDLEDQWILLGTSPLKDGEYILRSVVDPMGVIHESPGGEDPDRESERANEAVLPFSVEDSLITLD